MCRAQFERFIFNLFFLIRKPQREARRWCCCITAEEAYSFNFDKCADLKSMLRYFTIMPLTNEDVVPTPGNSTGSL